MNKVIQDKITSRQYKFICFGFNKVEKRKESKY